MLCFFGRILIRSRWWSVFFALYVRIIEMFGTNFKTTQFTPLLRNHQRDWMRMRPKIQTVHEIQSWQNLLIHYSRLRFFSSFFAIFYLLTDPKVLPNNFWYLFTYWNHWRPCCALLLIDRKGQLRARNCLCHQKGSIFSYMGHFYYYYCSSSFFFFFFNFIFFFHFPYFFYIACTLGLKLKTNIAIKSCIIASKVTINVFIKLFFLPQS